MRKVLLAVAALPALTWAAPAAASPAFVTASGVTGIRLCYFAPNGDPSTARASSCRDIHATKDTHAVTAELNGLADAARGRGTCVRDNNSEVRIVVSYRDRHRERVDVHFSSCQFATHTNHYSKQSTHAVRRDVARRAGFAGQVP